MKTAAFTPFALLAMASAAVAIDYSIFPSKYLPQVVARLEEVGLANRPVADLPAPLPESVGDVSLVADFDHAAQGSIPVYLINRSGRVLSINTQDYDIYLKLEFQDHDGTWKRTQSHKLSMCGNSYMTVPLLDQNFMRLTGFHPATGERAKIRFRLYRQAFEAVSNVGEGIINRAEAGAAQMEPFAFLSKSFDELAAIARSESATPLGTRDTALYELSTRGFPKSKVAEVLKPLAESGDEKIAESARGHLKRLERGR